MAEYIKLILGFVKSKKFPYFLAAALLLLSIVVIRKNMKLNDEVDRLENNVTSLMGDMEVYKTKNGNDVAKIRELELTKEELKNLCSDQVKKIEELGIKLKRLESMNTTGTHTSVGGTVPLKDTVIVQKFDTLFINHPVKYFEWSDTWNKISGVVDGNKVDCRYNGTDTLDIIVNRVPKRFLFFKYGTKYIEATVTNSNPSTRITYTRQIKLKK